MRLAIALAAVLVTFPAAAGGSLWCDSEDEKVRIEVRSGMLHNVRHSLNAFGATITIDDETIPADLREVSVGLPDQYWFDLEILNLMLVHEREAHGPHGYVAANIRTKYGPDRTDDKFIGEFEVKVADVGVFGLGGGPTFVGSIWCMAAE